MLDQAQHIWDLYQNQKLRITDTSLTMLKKLIKNTVQVRENEKDQELIDKILIEVREDKDLRNADPILVAMHKGKLLLINGNNTAHMIIQAIEAKYLSKNIAVPIAIVEDNYLKDYSIIEREQFFEKLAVAANLVVKFQKPMSVADVKSHYLRQLDKYGEEYVSADEYFDDLSKLTHRKASLLRKYCGIAKQEREARSLEKTLHFSPWTKTELELLKHAATIGFAKKGKNIKVTYAKLDSRLDLFATMGVATGVAANHQEAFIIWQYPRMSCTYDEAERLIEMKQQQANSKMPVSWEILPHFADKKADFVHAWEK